MKIYYKYVPYQSVLIIYPSMVLFMLYYKIVLVLIVKMIMMIMGVKQSVQKLYGTKQEHVTLILFKSNIDNTLQYNDCNDPSCVNEDYRTQFNKQFESLMNILLYIFTHIPKTCPPHKSTKVAGWNECYILEMFT